MFSAYLKKINEIYKTNNFLEHTFRTDFENLLNIFLKDTLHTSALTIIHEPQREKFGAPDFKIIDKASNIIGYIECKNITENISNLVDSEQIRKYLQITPNLIFTNYIDFILFKNGEISSHCSISSLLDIKAGKVKLQSQAEIEDMLKKFFLSSAEPTKDTRKLSVELARRTKILHDFILDEMTLDPDSAKHYFKVYKILKTIITDLEIKQFVDMYAQVISFGLLFFRLSKDMLLTRENILSNIPHYIPLLRDIFYNADFDKWSGNTIWILDEIFLLLNNVDSKIIKESLSYKNLSLINKRDANMSDPFLFLYEEFLKNYDKTTKISRGVFYTPESVVSFIIRSLDGILKDKLDIKKGFLDTNIKVLDFATGTGTFVLALIEYIKNELWRTNNQGLFNTEVNEFILENIYGFELLIVPYIICHLRIHEYLESFDFHYKGDKKERAEIYLTNTLENEAKVTLTNFFDDIDEEAQLAHKVKNDEDVLVIMGNPPYSKKSQNNSSWITNLVDQYKYVDGNHFGEKQNWFRDDYVKFIRFAQWKMEKIKKGCIGIITNHTFIDSITFRGMRQSLMNDFDQIYILDLHGSAKKQETPPDRKKNENVFDIEQGVCISFFIKSPKLKKEVYYFDFWGSRQEKYDRCYENSIDSLDWVKIIPDTPNYFFYPRKDQHIQNYNNFISVKDIFSEFSLPLMTGNDSITIKFTEKDINETVNIIKNNSFDYLLKYYHIDKESTNWTIAKAQNDLKKSNDCKEYYKNILYRPFDKRATCFTGKSSGFHSRPGSVSKNMLKHNIGLLLPRQLSKDTFQHAFCTDAIPEMCVISSSTKEQNQLFPLYLYTNTDLLTSEKKPNFTNSFQNFIINNDLHSKTPENILGYIYAVLYSTTYRLKYIEFLKIDFPRIPFTENKRIWGELSELGQRLIDLHLLKAEFDRDIVNFPVAKPDLKVTKSLYKSGQVWFNDSTFFDNVPEAVWEYYIGGYQVLDKWLKERKKHEYTLTGDDIKHFIKVCNVLAETIEIQAKIDELTKEWM